MFGLLRPTAGTQVGELSAISLFADLSVRELKIVQGLVHERDYLAGEVVFDEGEEGNALYIVRSGRVLICRQGRPEARITEVEAGGFFGELALLDSAPRTAQARAAAPCRLGVFFGSDFLSLLESEARLANRILLRLARHLGARLRQTTAAGAEQHS